MSIETASPYENFLMLNTPWGHIRYALKRDVQFNIRVAIYPAYSKISLSGKFGTTWHDMCDPIPALFKYLIEEQLRRKHKLARPYYLNVAEYETVLKLARESGAELVEIFDDEPYPHDKLVTMCSLMEITLPPMQSVTRPPQEPRHVRPQPRPTIDLRRVRECYSR